MEMKEVRWSEEQRFRQVWLWIILVLCSASGVLPMLYGLHAQLVLGKPWGNKPMSDGLLPVVAVPVIIISLALPLLFLVLRMITEVRPDGVYIRFVPFHRRFQRFGFDEIASFEATTYSPVADFGGWGIRRGFGDRGRAYNVSGDRGVLLTLTGGNTLMIGSQKADELEQEIRRASSG